MPKLFDHLRNKLGGEIELLHDVHERLLPKDAVWLAKALEPYRLFFFEDPLRPEHLDSFRLIRQQSGIAISMGEIFTGQWEALPLITEQLIDFIRCDLPHFGGITAARKVATVCEPFQILSAWHGPGNISPISHMANAHVSLSIPNFGVQEFGPSTAEATREIFDTLPELANGHITIGDKPGLGIDVNYERARQRPYIRRLRPMIRREDGTAWPY
jgi:mannonate dehydratase